MSAALGLGAASSTSFAQEHASGESEKQPTVTSEVVREGVRIIQRSDGSTLFIRPDGVRQLKLADGTVKSLLRDGRTVTEKPSGEQSVTPPPADEGGRRPRTVAPEYQSSEELASGKEPTLDNDVRSVPLPQSTGKHADWREFEKWVNSEEAKKMNQLEGKESGSAGGSSGSESVEYISEQKLEGGVIAKAKRGGGTDFIHPDGTIQEQDRNGTVVTTTPGGKKAIQYPGQEAQWADQLPGGGYRFPGQGGKGSLTELPDGSKLTEKADGSREWITPEGAKIVEKSDGSKEVYGSGGSLVSSEAKGPNGSVIRTDAEGNRYQVDPTTGGVIAVLPGSPNNTKMNPAGTSGKPSGAANGPAVDANAAKNGDNSAAGGSTPAKGGPPGIFGVASDRFKEFQKDPDMLNRQREQLEQEREEILELDPSTSTYRQRRSGFDKAFEQYKNMVSQIKAMNDFQNVYNPPPVDADGNVIPADEQPQPDAEELERKSKLFELTVEKTNLELEGEELRQSQSDLESMKSQFEQERDRLEQEKAALDQRDAEIQREREALNQEEFSQGLAEQLNRQQESLLDIQLNNAGNLIDYDAYDRCPNFADWDTCDHPRERQEWLNDQLDRALGAGFWDRFNEMNDKKRELEDKRFELDLKKKSLGYQAESLTSDIRNYSANNKVLTAQLSGYENKVNSFASKTSDYQQRVNRLKSEMEKLAKP